MKHRFTYSMINPSLFMYCKNFKILHSVYQRSTLAQTIRAVRTSVHLSFVLTIYHVAYEINRTHV